MEQTGPGALPESERAALQAVVDVLVLGEAFALSPSSASGLTLTEIRTVHPVRREHGCAGSPAQALGVSASSLSRILDRLEQRRLVRRAVDSVDRRRILAALTPSGAAFVAGLPGLAQSRIDQAAHDLGGEEREALACGVVVPMRASRRVSARAGEPHLAKGVGAHGPRLPSRPARADVREEMDGGYGI